MLECAEVKLVDGLTVRLVTSDSGLRAIDFDLSRPIESSGPGTNPIASEAVRQLRAYFAGQLRRFDLPLDMRGTTFQLRVWRELQRIPYGETRSYQQIAACISAPRAVRAVGAANAANPVPIVVPCHRVIGASGKLVGYGGGLPLKKRLLELEGALTPPLQFSRAPADRLA
jgi:methylated-DNA-[protein]-cysteine S-methyltransferase